MPAAAQPALRRAGAPIRTQADLYGLLTDLIGNWVGNGFNVISKPGLDVGKSFVLQVNATKEVLNFDPISGAIPNRGTFDPDLNIFALGYAQQVSDAVTNGLMHVERGMWLNMNAGDAPPQSIARLATIPHGDSLLARGTATVISGAPQIPELPATPVNADGSPIKAFGYFPPDPESFPQVNPFPRDPRFNLDNTSTVLTEAIAGQNITRTIVLEVTTRNADSGILNIPYVVRNANAIAMDSTFWIETVEPTDGPPFLQLQYSQNVILRFPAGPNGPLIDWPHISVGTLLKN
jgi:hypothetical protein